MEKVEKKEQEFVLPDDITVATQTACRDLIIISQPKMGKSSIFGVLLFILSVACLGNSAMAQSTTAQIGGRVIDQIRQAAGDVWILGPDRRIEAFRQA